MRKAYAKFENGDDFIGVDLCNSILSLSLSVFG